MSKETTIEDVLKKYIYKNIEGFGDGLTVAGAEAAMTEYASLNRQGWTRVEDGEKETFKQILLTDGENYSIGYFGSDGLTDWEVNKYFNSTPTHWMKLPEPPK